MESHEDDGLYEDDLYDEEDIYENDYEMQQILIKARIDAALEMGKINNLREKQQVDKMLKKGSHQSVNDIKEDLGDIKKIKMRIVEQYLCDKCDQVIPLSPLSKNKNEGFVIHGNIYVADPSQILGLVGNNFPDLNSEEKVDINLIKKSVLCKKCFGEIIGFFPQEDNYQGVLTDKSLIEKKKKY